MADINRIHVSPGVYATETVDMKAAASSVGVTKLALVGETLKGPAFQPYKIHSPKEYSSVFGGTSPEKFAGSNYPKYELPYIANEYLKQGTELNVVRVLGLSGYNAGPAWLITGEKSTDAGSPKEKKVIAVLRSRGTYKYRADMTQTNDSGCPCGSAYDSLTYNVGELTNVTSCSEPKSYNMSAVTLSEYYSINYSGSDCSSYTLNGTAVGFSAYYGDLGRFTINCIVGPSTSGSTPSTSGATSGQTVTIPVSLNKSDKDYILKVLGTSNEDGDMPLYVESLYDVAWEDLVINENYDVISNQLQAYNVGYVADYGGLDPVYGKLSIADTDLKKKDLGKRFLYTKNADFGDRSPERVRYCLFDYNTNMPEEINLDGIVTKSWNVAYNDNDTLIDVGEAFKITGTTNPGIYSNEASVEISLKDLCRTKLFVPSSTSSAAKKVCDIDSEGNPIIGANSDIYKSSSCIEGRIYTVVQITDLSGKKHYVYKAYDGRTTYAIKDESERIMAQDRLLMGGETGETERPSMRGTIVYSYEDGLYYKLRVTRPVIVVQETNSQQTNDPFYLKSFSGVASGITSGNLVIKSDDLNPTDFKVEESKHNASNWNKIPMNYGGFTWPVKKGYDYKVTRIDGSSTTFDYTVYAAYANYDTYYDRPTTVVITCDLNDYKSQFRYSSTPWVVSNVKGDFTEMELNKLFRFHTISDGTESANEVKVSVTNIRPDSGEFDVIVRAYNDSDSNPSILERFSKCTMTKGKSFIGYKIGTVDGIYESKSKYITVEVNESTAASNSVPAGFLGYPIPVYSGATVTESEHQKVSIAPIAYNKDYNEDISKRKQYFGLSDLTGYDYDYFSFKGNMATLERAGFVTNGFHLDCRVNPKSYGSAESTPTISVDGVSGYTFDTVSVNARTSSLSNTPVIGTEDEMQGSIFEDVSLRKFTMLFYGGFDGWDTYRDQRTNTDEFSTANYKGYINRMSGQGYSFDTFHDASTYGIEERAITSDYYSTLAGVSLLKNPEETDINLLATPGIDTMNNTKLVQEVFNILEDRADTFYIVTTPDKESGSSDYVEDIPDVDEIVTDFSDKELDNDYTATYYPWVKIEDNGEYVWLPPTRDVIRNLTESDNTNTTMNLAPAGTSRGKVNAIKARKNLKNGESDELYEANINPVRTYAQEGLVIMGQKTLRQEDDLMNRVDVRRMVLRLRKLIAIGCLGLIFEPNDNATVQSFRSIINGVMQTFIDNRAIEKWTMDVDDSQEARDRLELGATIYIKPIRALEYITLNFIVTNNDVYFEN